MASQPEPKRTINDQGYDVTIAPPNPDKPDRGDWGREGEDGFRPGTGNYDKGDWSAATVEILDPGILYDEFGNIVQAPW